MCISIGIYVRMLRSWVSTTTDGPVRKGVPYSSPTALEFGGKFDLTSAYAFVVHFARGHRQRAVPGKQPCRRRHVSDTSHPVAVVVVAAAAAATLVLTAD
jgi:hypothetical protein